jgi:hypothetical protein
VEFDEAITAQEERIRRRAREIWEENGRPAGRDDEFWLQAERESREAEDDLPPKKWTGLSYF